jgi:hypothetical protein
VVLQLPACGGKQGGGTGEVFKAEGVGVG